jgi:hypothetical protein
MKHQNVAACTAAVLAGLAGSASAGMVSATITADNHYALFADSPAGIIRIGGNETGATDGQGELNWVLPESWTFDTTGRIYIAVWSDPDVAQGLLADILLPTGETLNTGDSRWQVYITGQSRGTDSPWPEAAEISAFVEDADTNNEWTTPYVGPTNGSDPGQWGQISNISAGARWTWGNPSNSSDPLIGGSAVDNYQVFSIAVPAPAGVALTAAATLFLLGRRRR